MFVWSNAFYVVFLLCTCNFLLVYFYSTDSYNIEHMQRKAFHSVD